MIESGIFTKPVLSRQSEIANEQIELPNTSTSVNRGIMFHLVSAHIFHLSQDPALSALQKMKLTYEFGNKLGTSLLQEECMGYVKYCANKEKTDAKQFVGEMKLLNGKVWYCLIGSKGKLFSIDNETLTSSSFKIDDKQFSIGRAFLNTSIPAQKQLRNLTLQFCKGIIEGCLDKLGLDCTKNYGEGTEGSVYVELKNLVRKPTFDRFEDYCEAVNSIVI